MGENKVAGNFEVKKKATEKNRVVRYSKKKEEIEGANGNMSEISFFDWRIINCNWQKNKKKRDFKLTSKQKITLSSGKNAKAYKQQ